MDSEEAKIKAHDFYGAATMQRHTNLTKVTRVIGRRFMVSSPVGLVKAQLAMY